MHRVLASRHSGDHLQNTRVQTKLRIKSHQNGQPERRVRQRGVSALRPRRNHIQHIFFRLRLSQAPPLHLLAPPAESLRKVAKRAACEDPSRVRVHLPPAPLPRNPQSPAVRPHARPASPNGLTLSRHDRKVSSEPRQPSRVWRQRTEHGSRQSVHPQKQGADDCLPRLLVEHQGTPGDLRDPHQRGSVPGFGAAPPHLRDPLAALGGKGQEPAHPKKTCHRHRNVAKTQGKVPGNDAGG